MNWLAEIIKNLTISRALVASVFVTSVVMYYGPILFPNDVPKLQFEFVPYLFAVLVITGCLLLLWGLAGLWTLTKSSVKSASRFFVDSSLSEPETALLFYMAKDSTKPINLDNIDYAREKGTKLELHNWTKQLKTNGLVRIEWNDNLVSLTNLGRLRALEIQRQVKLSNGDEHSGKKGLAIHDRHERI